MSGDFEAPGYFWRDGDSGRQAGVWRGLLTVWDETTGEPVGDITLPVRDPIEMASILHAIAEKAGLEVVQPIVLRDPEAERVDVLNDALDDMCDRELTRESDAGADLLTILRRRGFELVRRAS